MKRFRSTPKWFVVILISFLPTTTVADSRLYGHAEAGCELACPMLIPVVPLLPAPAGCMAVELPVPCVLPLVPLVIAAEPCDPPTPVVKIKVRVPACGKPGEPIEYRICVYNDSPADAHHVVVKNAVPANARFVKASPEPHVKEPELEWRLGTMKAGSGHDITLVLQPVDVGRIGQPSYAEDVRNCTRVAFEHGQCVTTRVAALAPPARPPEVVPVPKLPTEKEPPAAADEKPQLSLSIAGPKKQYLNLATRYFVTVANKGKAAATNLLVDFTLADKTTFVKASDNGKHVLDKVVNKVAWVLGTLEAGASRTVVVELKSAATGELCHKAMALADKGAKAQAEFCTVFAGVSALLLEMFDTEDPIPVGGATSYPILVRNTGTAPVTNLQLKAIIPDALTLTRAKAPVNHNLGEALPGAKVLVFDPLPTLEPGAQADYVVFVVGARPADVRFRIEMSADQLEGGPVIEEESTRVYAEDGGAPALPLIRNLSRTRPYGPGVRSEE